MNKCPNCKNELVEGSVICPHCDFVLNENSQISSVDDELEKFSQMIFNMENNIDVEYSAPVYTVGDFDKKKSGDNPDQKDNSSKEEKIEEVVKNEPVVEPEPVVVNTTPKVFTASASGVVEKVEVKEETINEEIKDDEIEDEKTQVLESDEEPSDVETSDEDDAELIEEVEEPVQNEEENASEKIDNDFSEFIHEGDNSVDSLDKLFEELAKMEKDFDDGVNSFDAKNAESEIVENGFIESDIADDINKIFDEINNIPSGDENEKNEESNEVEEQAESFKDEEETESIEIEKESEIVETEKETQSEIIEDEKEIQDETPQAEDEISQTDDSIDLDEIVNAASYVKKSDDINTFGNIYRNQNTGVNLDKTISEFYDIASDFDENQKIDKDNLGETYLKLNFVTTDKFATLISSENEKVESDNSKLKKESKTKFTDIYELETIIDAEKLSDDELQMTIEAVNIQKVELIHNLEIEEKELIINKYKELRNKTFGLAKYITFGGLLILIVVMTAFIYDVNLVDLKSKLYMPSSIETYDTYIFSSVLEIVDITDEVNKNFEHYKNGELTKTEMLAICDENSQKLNKYKFIFEKEVYDEAENYVFTASNCFFFASFYIENIESYVLTGDDYYLSLNKNNISSADDLVLKVKAARLEFLKALDYSDEEIGILNYKANSGK